MAFLPNLQIFVVIKKELELLHGHAYQVIMPDGDERVFYSKDVWKI